MLRYTESIMYRHNFNLSVRIIILLRQSFFKSFILEKIPFMLLKNKTIRYKVLFNIMKKINFFYKENNLFFIFYCFTFFFILNMDLFGATY